MNVILCTFVCVCVCMETEHSTWQHWIFSVIEIQLFQGWEVRVAHGTKTPSAEEFFFQNTSTLRNEYGVL